MNNAPKQSHVCSKTLLDWLQRPNEHHGTDIATHIEELQEMHELFLQELANRLAGPMNRHLQLAAKDIAPQKCLLARWLNEQLESLHLAVRCPKTGRPGFLLGNHGADIRGQFQINVPEPGRRRRVTKTAIELPELEFTAKVPRRKLEQSWAETIVSGDQTPPPFKD